MEISYATTLHSKLEREQEANILEKSERRKNRQSLRKCQRTWVSQAKALIVGQIVTSERLR